LYVYQGQDEATTRRLIDNSSLDRVEEFKIFGKNTDISKFYSERISEQIEVRECLLSFGVESFVFQFAIQKFLD